MKSLNRAMGKTIRFLHIYQNMVIGALVIVLSIVMLIASNSIKVIASSLTAVDNAAFLPRVIFGVLICLGILFLVMGGKQTAANRATAPEGEALDEKSARDPSLSGSIAGLFVYVLFMDPSGFCHLVHSLYGVYDDVH